MHKIIIMIVSLIFSNSALSAELNRMENNELSLLLSAGQILYSGGYASDKLPYEVRVISAPVRIGECWGTIDSCPNERLIITASTGDLGSTPGVFELPVSKGWEFVKVLGFKGVDENKVIGIELKTILRGANIETAERANWQSLVYTVWFSEYKAMFEVK